MQERNAKERKDRIRIYCNIPLHRNKRRREGDAK